MKKYVLFILLISSMLLLAIERIDVLENEPFPLQHWMTDAESQLWETYERDFFETDPPEGEIHNIAEFEAMEGVLVRYPFGIPVSLIAAMSQHAKVVTIVSSSSQQSTVLSQYNSNGVNTDNCDFMIAASDSYWTRDFGPWYITDGNGDFGIVNFPYNRPRPNDNDIPIEMADFLDINLFGMNVYHTGGNYMTDGLGISASSDLVYEENSITNDEVDARMLSYLGIHTYHVLEDPNNTYIDHIDCWGKLLDVDKVLIREVPTSHAQYDEIEEVAEYFAAQTSSWGNNYQVFRVNTPNDQPYSNSLILNDHVYVPQTGSTYDDDALAVYEEAMPGYTVVGVMSGSQPWESTDALHCRTKGIADRQMLYIYHMPLLDDQPQDVDLEITCDITAYSGEAVIADSVICYYKTGSDDYTALQMTNVSGNTWSAEIPGQPAGTIVSYYIHAADVSEKSANHPFIGAQDPHVYYAGGAIAPMLDIDPEIVEVEMQPDQVNNTEITLTNTGGGVINYSIEFQDTSRDITGSNVTCSSEYFTPGETIELSFTATNQSTDSEWIHGVDITFPDGFTVTGATDFTGGTSPMVYDGSAGNAAVVGWWGETGSGYGVLQDGDSAEATVTVEVAADYSGDAVLAWTLFGDNYGAEPHQVSGEMTLESYGGAVSWISASQLGGDLFAQQSDVITLEFDTADLEEGIYTCNMIVSYNETEETTLPIVLTISSSAADENSLPLVTDSYIYPNPFYRNQRSSSRYCFTLSENVENAEVAVYNIKGQKIADIYNGNLSAGEHQLSWQAEDNIAAGVYFYIMSSKGQSAAEKFIILK